MLEHTLLLSLRLLIFNGIYQFQRHDFNFLIKNILNKYK